MAALSDNSIFKDEVNKADEKIVASLTEVGLIGRFEFTVVYTTSEVGGVVTVSRSFRGLTSVTDTGVKEVSA